MKYASVIVDNNTNATDLIYTYACDDDNVCIGNKVRVPFSVHNKEIDGYVVSVSDEKPEGIKRFKHIASIDPEFKLTEEAIRTATWMHKRYLCRYIEAVKCFVPSFEAKRKTKDPFENIELSEEDAKPKKLNSEQQEAFDKIASVIDKGEHKIILLHGVTGCGKTEIYLQAMDKVIASGKQGIILVPEISLTPQAVSRFMSRFGRDSVAVLHSKLTPAQRSVEYKRIESGEVKLVIGARSAIFAPFKNIGLIVLDEEHETSYKSDSSPKYDAIEVATKRAIDHKALVILGSATPSINDYYRSEKGIFDKVEILSRYNKTPLPKVQIVDMTLEVRSGNRNLFSNVLANEMRRNLDNGKQIILFLNRRGYSSFITCRECGYVVKCDECGIAMPYHKDDDRCECHYCGRKVRLPKVCPECGSKIIGSYGVGTQQVEEKTKELFPDAKVERLDLDAIKKKGELESALKRFGSRKTDILIGTQLVAKGLDFENVGLVGVISADVTLNIPDFRSSERTFQLLTQAAGRSGRGEEQGTVIIQTYSPDSTAIQFAKDHNYKSFYEKEIKIRELAAYPPYTDIYQLVIQDKDKYVAENTANKYAAMLKKDLSDGIYVLGPAASHLVKQGGMYRYQLLIKAPTSKRKEVNDKIEEVRRLHVTAKNEANLITIDINPFSYI